MKTKQFTLNYWSPKTMKVGKNIERIYVNPVNGEDKPKSLGYFEKSEIVRERDPNSDSYYERHRYIKGEDVAYKHQGVKWVGDENIMNAVCDSVFGSEKVGLKDNWQEAFKNDSWGFFRAIARNSRGFKFAVCGKYSKDEDTKKRAKETEKENEARQTLVFNF